MTPLKPGESPAKPTPSREKWKAYHFTSPRRARNYWGIGSDSTGLLGIARDMREENARLAARAVNAHDALVSALRILNANAKAVLEETSGHRGLAHTSRTAMQLAIEDADAALSLAESDR